MKNTTTKHTPGPWEIIHGKEHLGIEGNHDTYVGHVENRGVLGRESTRHAALIHCDGSEEQRQANARLIAAAPDLLEALSEMVSWVKGTIEKRDWPLEELGRACAAIAKVEDKQPSKT